MRLLKIFYSSLLASLFLLVSGLYSKVRAASNVNEVIVESIDSMPIGGGYATSTVAMNRLSQSVTFEGDQLKIMPEKAKPSFCSEATYLVFLKTIQMLQNKNQISLSAEVLQALLPKHQSDGQGIWGCWNANGPGVACLFKTLNLGVSFTDLSKAEPGDFLKIFWTDAIGASEHGHLVIYLGKEKRGSEEYITCWSSNIPGGYGKKSYRRTSIRRMIFSRFIKPQNLANVFSLPKKDSYLAGLLFKSSSPGEMKIKCGIND